MESRLPMLDLVARPFRREGQEHPIRASHHRRRALADVAGRGAVDRYAPGPLEQPAEDPAEERVLPEVVNAKPQRDQGGHADDEIPVGGVGGDDDHAVRHVGHRAFDTPAQDP